MSVTESAPPVQQRGRWPGPIRLRRGWARADARPWNDRTPDANLRIIRGGASFLDACTAWLIGHGAPSVLSPPLGSGTARTWESVGYQRSVPLALMRLELVQPVRSPDHLVVAEDVALESLLRIDHAAFDDFWRFDRVGLEEAINATSNARTLTIRGSDANPVAYAVIGLGHAVSYLQRLAVHPDWQRSGMGRSLVRASARVARTAGTRAMMLNTQQENEAAIRLYASEGFVTQPEPLAVLRRS